MGIIKKIFITSIIFAFTMFLLPLIAIKDSTKAITVSTNIENIPSTASEDYFRILNCDTGKIEKIKAVDYIFGVAAAEMPASYEDEALKAQAVAAYTFSCYKRNANKNLDYDLSTDYKTYQSYISKEEARERWGENADLYEQKIEKAVKSVSGYILIYQNKPALAVYHAISSGKTESCKNVWGKDYPYLQAVSSEYDKLSPDYISVIELTSPELEEKLKEKIKFSGETKNYFGKVSKTNSGTVKEITVCNQKIKGSELRSLLNLRSSAFDVSYTNEKFVFTVYGYGHSVGMSQFGANYLAKQGADFKEILNTYYNGCKIKKN